MDDVLVAGEINPDLILSGQAAPEYGQVETLVEDAVLTIGSSSAIFACGAARLGLKVAFIGICGDDLFGGFMLDELQRRGVDVSGVIVRKGGTTGLSVILDRSTDRAILTYPGLVSALRAEDIPDERLRAARHLHVASYFLQKGLQSGLPALFTRAHALRLTTSLDPNYDPTGVWGGLAELLAVTDIFLPNVTEARALTAASDIESAARQLGGAVPLVAVKLGAQGALACQDGAISKAPALAVQIADTVGAGDSFDAGFLYGYLHTWPLQRSLQLACVCGSLSLRAHGGTQGQPTLEEAMQYVPA